MKKTTIEIPKLLADELEEVKTATHTKCTSSIIIRAIAEYISRTKALMPERFHINE